MIPKIIHQIFLSGSLPDVLRANADRLRRMNPEWTYLLYDAAAAQSFVAEHYGADILGLYDSISPLYGAARADFLRHLLLFKFGGAYLDIKTYANVPLDSILRSDDQFIVSQWNNNPNSPTAGFGLHRELQDVPGGEYQIYALFSIPGHAFTAAAIAAISKNIRDYRPWKGVGRIGVLRTTGPIAFTRAIHPLLNHESYRQIDLVGAGIDWSLPGSYNHGLIFPNHYSGLREPVIKQGRMGQIVNRGLNIVRWLRSRRK